MNMNTRWQVQKYQVFTVIMALFFIAGMGLSSCAKEESPAEVVLGALLPLSGDLSSSGESANASLEIAVTDFNEYLSNIGSQIRVRLIVEDTETDPVVALEKLENLTIEGVRVIIGPGSSSEVKAVKEYAAEEGILLISYSSTAPSLAISGDNLFRFVPNDTLQAEALAKLMWEQGSRVVIPMWRGDIWGDDLFEATRSSFKEFGGVVIDGIRYSPTTKDFSAELESLNQRTSQAIAEHGTDSVGVHLMAFEEAVFIFTQAQNYPLLSTVKWYGSDGNANDEVLVSNTQAAQFAVKTSYTNSIFGNVITEESELVRAQIREKINRDPVVYSLAAYDALWVAAKAYLATGTKTLDSLKKAVREEAKQYTGITGWTYLNEEGDRKFGNYDFWAVEEESGTFRWKHVAIYRIDPVLPGRILYVDE